MDEKTRDVWAVVELMGHVRLAGRLTEEEKFGSKLGRLDIPTEATCPLLESDSHKIAADACPCCSGSGVEQRFVTQFFGGGSVYRITLVSEAAARLVARKNQPAPVYSWELPKQLAPAAVHLNEDDEVDGIEF